MMRSRLFLAVVVLAATSARAADERLTPLFAEPLREALASIGMTPSDLTFRRDYVPRDSFRLSLMDRTFDDPLGSLDRITEMSARVRSVDTPAELVSLVASWLGLRLKQVRPAMAAEPYFADSLWFGLGLTPLQPEMRSAASTVYGTFGLLAPDRFDSLSSWARTTVSEEERTDQSASVDIYAMRREENRERERARRNLSAAGNIDRAALFSAARNVFLAAWRMRQAVLAIPRDVCDTVPSRTWDTPLGRFAIGCSGPDHYTGSYAVIIDYGGDDVYDLAPPEDGGNCPVQVIIDRSGDDSYNGPVGSGTFGISLLLDLAGDDTYRGDRDTQGAGTFGVGVVWDESGDDAYFAKSGSQGVGLFGLGALVDLSGRDVYQIGQFGQALGGTAGVGILEDRGGNDAYLSGGTATDVLRYDDHYLTMAQGVGLGIRPVASGGVGLLSDRRGNDTYVADIFGQGVGYWLGIGGLVDERGRDRYTAYQYAQGAGVHLAAGLLVDGQGNDVYSSNGVSLGCGHDLSVGVLFDGAGDDSYVSEGLSLGAGNANAISLLVDMNGRDGYIARRSDVMGYSDRRREYGMVGVMLDLGGEDRYGAPFGKDGGWWTHSTYGVGADRQRADTSVARHQPNGAGGRSAEEIAGELAAGAESLFVQASNPLAAYRYLVDPAERKLAARGAVPTSFWAGKLAAQGPRERHALVRIHQKLFADGDTSDVPMLLDSLVSDEARTRRMAAYLLGFSRTKKPVGPLVSLLRHPDWQTRAVAAESLWRLKDARAETALIAALRDSVDLVRHAAALALERAGTAHSDSALARALSDPSQIVRHSAERALAAHPTSTPILVSIILTDTTNAALYALRAASAHTSDSLLVLPAIIHALGDSLSWTVRAEAAEAAETLALPAALPALEAARTGASHPYLVSRLDEAIRALRPQEAAVTGNQ